MMNLPLLMAAPPSASPGQTAGHGRPTNPDGNGTSFEATLTGLLGDAGREVADMVETLGKLADLDREHDALAAIGWPMSALLALKGDVDQRDLIERLAAQLEVDGGVGGEVAVESDVEVEGVVPRDVIPDTSDKAGESDDDPSLGLVRDASVHLLGGTPASGGDEGELHADPNADRGAAVNGQGRPGASSIAGSSQGSGTAPSTTGAAPVTDASGATGSTGHLDVDEDAARPAAESARVTAAASKVDERGSATARETTSDRAGTVRVDAVADRAPGAGEPLTARPEVLRPTPNAGMSSAIQRVMEAIDRLETLPPPQRLTVDLGEVRIRVSMEDGQVRLAVIDGDGDVGDELLQDARDELAQRGFDLGGDDDHGSGAGVQADDMTDDDQPQRPRTRERVATGLRL